MSTEPERENMPDQQPSIETGEKKKQPKNVKKEIMSWILTIVTAVVAALLIRTFLFEPIRVDGDSMSDTLHNGELVFVTKPEYLLGSPSRQDVIICRYPNRTEYFVKRLIALPGDTVEIKYDRENKTNTVFVNGKATDEYFLTPSRNDSNNSFAQITLGDDQYFVMGDNRDNSNDSRFVGPITSNQIVGHVRFVFYPFGSLRGID